MFVGLGEWGRCCPALARGRSGGAARGPNRRNDRPGDGANLRGSRGRPLCAGFRLDILQNMSCSKSLTGPANNNGCNEPHRQTGEPCNPVDEAAESPAGSGTRDTYNAYDIAWLIPQDQTSERNLNCVGYAGD